MRSFHDLAATYRRQLQGGLILAVVFAIAWGMMPQENDWEWFLAVYFLVLLTVFIHRYRNR